MRGEFLNAGKCLEKLFSEDVKAQNGRKEFFHVFIYLLESLKPKPGSLAAETFGLQHNLRPRRLASYAPLSHLIKMAAGSRETTIPTDPRAPPPPPDWLH